MPSSSLPSNLPAAQKHFGENYLQELQQKAEILPQSIRWHFIGGLQSNKCKQLAEIPNLWCVSSVDTAKKADGLERGRAGLIEKLKSEGKLDTVEQPQLRLHVQVNTSGEDSKSGVEPQHALELCKHIVEKCPNLQLTGLMTIGAIARSKETTADNENEDFVALREIRAKVAEGLGWEEEKLELSMGMSADFEGAIAMGSGEVRVGSTIFGDRPPRSEAKVLEEAT